jgi:hypothetical protein
VLRRYPMSTFNELSLIWNNERKETARNLQQKRKICYARGNLVNKAVLSSINDTVANTHHNEKLLEEEAKKLQTEIIAFVRQTSQWLEQYRVLNRTIVDLGEVETWTNRMQAELRTVTSSLQYISAEHSRRKPAV